MINWGSMGWHSMVVVLCGILATAAGQQKEEKVQLWHVEASLTHPSVMNLLKDGHIDPWSHHANSTKILVDEENLNNVLEEFAESGIEHHVEVENMLELVEQEELHRTRSKRSVSEATAGRMDWSSYHPLEDINGYLGWLNTSYPDLVQVISVATSAEGRPVYAVRVTDRRVRTPKYRIWIEGGIHAREWISPAATTFLLHQVATNPDWRDQILPHTEWYFVPVANPDGYAHTFKGGKARLWRKNRRINNVNLPDRCKGVDLNRNWDMKWGVGASRNPCSELYMGDVPFSEPETEGLKFVMERVGPIDLFITFHSFGQSVLYPWGWTAKPTKGARRLDRIGRRFLEAVDHVSHGKVAYALGSSGALLGFASGATDDWAYGKLGAKAAYTIELRDKGRYGFLLPEAQIAGTVREAAAGVQCMTSFIIGQGVCARDRRNVINFSP